MHASWERRRARWWTITVVNTHGALIQFLGTMMTALVLYRTGTLVQNQELSIGVALAVQLLANLATQPLQALAPLYNQFIDVRVSWRRLCEPFDEPILPEEDADARPCPPLDGPVTFDHVAFTYPQTTRTVLRDVSFTMEPGKVTALVGYTGAGKSSIAKVLARTYDPDAGSVTVNGVDLRDLTLDTFRAKLGIVPQDPFVFKGTVASNIRYSKLDATDEEVEGAVRRGRRLGSAVLARRRVRAPGRGRRTQPHRRAAPTHRARTAWLAQPDILVLDEATSLLDTGVEDIIIQAVHNLGCTTLMITHRESVAMKSDNIIVLESVASSTPDPRSRSHVPADRTTASGASRTTRKPPSATRNSRSERHDDLYYDPFDFEVDANAESIWPPARRIARVLEREHDFVLNSLRRRAERHGRHRDVHLDPLDVARADGPDAVAHGRHDDDLHGPAAALVASKGRRPGIHPEDDGRVEDQLVRLCNTLLDEIDGRDEFDLIDGLRRHHPPDGDPRAPRFPEGFEEEWGGVDAGSPSAPTGASARRPDRRHGGTMGMGALFQILPGLVEERRGARRTISCRCS